LAYAGSQSNGNGSLWYGHVKTTQSLAKDILDAINNGVAFAFWFFPNSLAPRPARFTGPAFLQLSG